MPDYLAFRKAYRNDLLHVGKGHDDNPPGRGSGRYPYGSGDRPFQRSGGPKPVTKADLSNLQRIKSFFQRNKFLLEEKIGINSDKYKSGMSYLSQHDFEWQEVEGRRFPDGHVDYFPPAYVIDEFMKEGSRNPYPRIDNSLFNTVKGVNPDFGERGTTKNCTKCAAALEMRKRGYDVCAGRQSDSGDSRSFLRWFKGATMEESSYNDIERDLIACGEGSSGTLRIGYKNTKAGHAVNWEVKNGRVSIADGQNGYLFDSEKNFSSDKSEWFNAIENPFKTFFEDYDADPDIDIQWSRLDNCEPDLEAMAEDSVIRRKLGSKVRNKNTGRYVDTW